MRLSIAISALIAMLAIPACGFQAFSGSACDGDAGLNVPCDGTCWVFDERHSFRADTSGNAQSVVLYVETGCVGQMFNFARQAAECTNVNTGTNIRSFHCFSDTSEPPASPPTPLIPLSSTGSGTRSIRPTASVSTHPPAPASTPAMLFSPTGSSTQDTQSTASISTTSISTAPPASAASNQSTSLSVTSSSTQEVPPPSTSIDNNDGRGTRSRVGAIAAAVSGAVAALLLVCAAWWGYKRRPRRAIDSLRGIDEANARVSPYTDRPPEDDVVLEHGTPISIRKHNFDPAISSIPPSDVSAVAADIGLEVARMRVELERLSRLADHDTPPRYGDESV